MYDIALTVQSCLRADTTVHVAWVVDGSAPPTEAVALTPGGGRIGTLLDGAFDVDLPELASRVGSGGGIVDLEVSPLAALAGGLEQGSTVRIAVAPGALIPEDAWEAISDRRPVAFSIGLDGDRFTGATIADPAGNRSEVVDDHLEVSLSANSKVVIAGGGPIAEAVAAAFRFVSWEADVVPEVSAATGIMATLSPTDAIVVMGHDLEISGRALEAAVRSKAGYIGSIGSHQMQEMRREWISYRGAAWDDRVHGPAGLDIGADDPPEIAIAIVAEALGHLRGNGS
ncbi:MAG: XdhC family protein [Acidimicrobiia bacterium]|nr:MAG: XdhC family protein [Acidimicrobiia bacterium]